MYNLADGDYYISDLYTNPNKEDGVLYSKSNDRADALPLDFDVEFKISNKKEENEVEENKTILKSIILKSEKAKQNDKVYVDIEVENFELKQAMLSFNDNTNNKNFVVYLKDIKDKPTIFYNSVYN